MKRTIAHLSDVHLGPLPQPTTRQLISKRIIGYLNWRYLRGETMDTEMLDALVSDLLQQAPDHIAISGDMTNLALPAEFDQTIQWLQNLGDPGDVSLVPGNHDAYVFGALKYGLRKWEPWARDDNQNQIRSTEDFPYSRVRDHVQIIGCSTAVPTPPFLAAGYFGQGQAERLGEILDSGREQNLFRIVMLHHPPLRIAAPVHKRLYGIGRFQSVIANHGAELILHGHTHLPQRHAIDGPDHEVPVFGVPAASQTPGHKKPPAAFNLFTIERKPDGTFKCQHEERSVTDLRADAIAEAEAEAEADAKAKAKAIASGETRAEAVARVEAEAKAKKEAEARLKAKLEAEKYAVVPTDEGHIY